MEQLEQLFQAHHLRLTSPRRSVFRTLEQAHAPLFIHDIIKSCDDCDRTSIYRTLETFIKLGIVEIIPTGWKQRYELSDLFRAHHHHLQCVRCGELISIDTPKLEASIKAIADDHGYQLTSHHIELHGICKKCQ
jgi:Fur family transcriptional regulator, ferric uptake regulator